MKIDIRDPKSIGLTGMRERAFAMGGTLTITGTRGEGTTITLSVPLNEGKKGPEIPKGMNFYAMFKIISTI